MHPTIRFCAALYIVLVSYVATGETAKSQRFTVGIHSPPALKNPSPNVPAAHILPLTRTAGASKGAGYLQSLRKGNHVNGVYSLAPVTFIRNGQTFATDLKIGSQSFQATVDTGSSDTWVVGRGFQCISSGARVPESKCMFGPAYNISSRFKRIPNENLNLTYDDGSCVTGVFGKETVTIAGIPIKNQQVGVVDYASYAADGVSSGLIGLADPSLTSAFAGTDPALDYTSQIIYNPVITNLFNTGYVAPVFSLALERSSISSGTAAGGFLAIGGLPPVVSSPIFATAPFQLATITDASTNISTLQYQYYTIVVNSFTYERSDETNWTHPGFPSRFPPLTNSSHHQVIVDSGTVLIYLPTGIANAVNELFDPPAVYDASTEHYVVNCSAKAPEFGVEIDDQTIYVNEKDLIQDSGNGSCVSGISDAGSGLLILGDVFLKNVLAVFDLGASEMRFAAREFY